MFTATQEDRRSRVDTIAVRGSVWFVEHYSGEHYRIRVCREDGEPVREFAAADPEEAIDCLRAWTDEFNDMPEDQTW